MTADRSLRVSWLWFAGAAAGIYAAALAVAARLAHLDVGADVVAAALTFDLVLVVPAAFYLCVVRRHGLPLAAVAPIFVLAVVAASWILPADRQQTLGVLGAMAAPVELGLLGWIGWRAARAIRRAGGGTTADPLERIRIAGLDLTGNARVAAILATEIGVLLYGLG